ncbi:MAG TPA: indolepyruvate ferredoxin oxidoreductase subunit alpha [Clostridiales bacterium]|jgi:indolepyruvate ferredoxin oxidoreductase alpha subunit|nr:indolepyruvate ferredoxin oxidoreductase subunit alpha [Clostridiales bacterium]
MIKKELLTGNQAIARGAYEAGLLFASGYPGTPSTEILETMTQYKDELYCEWAPNEKVALEAALGAAIAGARSMATMKHVGLNVAADPLFTASYTGVEAGCIIISADDPGMHSSQNEQDNRNYAVAAKCLMLEPADSQEAKDFTKLAFELSERFDTPVLLRLTTRICHSKSLVELEERRPAPAHPYTRKISKYVATPANARRLRLTLEERIAKMTDFSNQTELNRVEEGGRAIGVVCAGVTYQYAREVFGDRASYFKVGMSWPLPVEAIRKFSKTVDKLYVIEELDPYMENQLRQAGIDCTGKAVFPCIGELDSDRIRQALGEEQALSQACDLQAVGRPPTLCAGCPHRGVFQALRKRKDLMISGDIGCYTLGSAPPLSAMDTTICMGASISAGHGAAAAFRLTGQAIKTVAVIGDSTFFHSGITSLMNITYNRGNCVALILDNRITGMTGHQENPGSGYTLMGEPAVEVDIPKLCQAIGFKAEAIHEINPLDLDEVDRALNQALAADEPSVIIAAWPCAIKKFTAEDRARFDLNLPKCRIVQEKCTKCLLCVKTGCPAIHRGDEINIDPNACTGCAVCYQVCPFNAIVKEGQE